MSTKKINKPVTAKKRQQSQPTRAKVYPRVFETDSTYFLKLVVFILLGTLWLKFAEPISWQGIRFTGVPLGLVLGIIGIAKFEKYQEDRKIWYAVLVVVSIICYFVPAGVVI
ncbi:MAG: hypothetical protein ABIQ04_01765 [Candidatus Saccharimonadales bacterium]